MWSRCAKKDLIVSVFVENKEALRLLHVLVARPWTQNKRMVFEMATPSLHDLHGLRNQLGMLSCSSCWKAHWNSCSCHKYEADLIPLRIFTSGFLFFYFSLFVHFLDFEGLLSWPLYAVILIVLTFLGVPFGVLCCVWEGVCGDSVGILWWYCGSYAKRKMQQAQLTPAGPYVG